MMKKQDKTKKPAQMRWAAISYPIFTDDLTQQKTPGTLPPGVPIGPLFLSVSSGASG